MNKWSKIAFAVAAAVLLILAGVPEIFIFGALPLFGVTTATTDIDEAMKVIFEDSVTESFVVDTEAFDIFTQDANVKVDETTGGRFIETAQLFHLPAGVGSRAEGEYIPIPQGPTVVNSRINLRKVMGVLEMTGEVFDTVKSNEGAFMNYASRAMPLLVELVNNELDRMLLGYGAGVVARIDDAAPDATIGIDSSFGVNGYTKAWTLFQENETIRIGPNADGSAMRVGQAKVLDVDPEGNAGDGLLTLDALPAGGVDNDFIFMGDTNVASSQTAAGEDREVMGLLGMVDDGSILQVFQNINRSTFRKWQSVVHTASGPLLENVLVSADDAVFEKGAGVPSIVLSSRDQLREYWKDLKSDRSINDPRGQFDGGLNNKGLKIHTGDRTLTLRASRKLPPQITFMLSPDTFKRFHNVGWKWDDRTGSIWNRVGDGTGHKDAFFAVGYIRLQTACTNPRKNVVIRGLTVTP